MGKKEKGLVGGKNKLVLLALIFSVPLSFIFFAHAASKNQMLIKKGTVSSLNKTILVVTKKNKSFMVETVNAKLYSDDNKQIFLDQIYKGDGIDVTGITAGGVIHASLLKDRSINKKNLNARTHSLNTSNNSNSTIPQKTSPLQSSYPLHTNITATVFWVGEPQGDGSSENNAISAWDDAWQEHYGCFDDPSKRNGYFPQNCTPKENPFYFDLPYDDFSGDGRRSDAYQVVPWVNSQTWQENQSMLKNRWIKVTDGANVCYAQWEDAGPYVYDDAQYVFGHNDERPKNTEANNAGMDVSPAVRDCLKFDGINNDDNKVSWQFLESGEVPAGPWKNIVTTSGTYWP